MADAIHDYSKEPVGQRHRNPSGVVQECPQCGQKGLRRVYCWRRGRYHVVYIHEAERMEDGTYLALGMCSVRAPELKELPLSERSLGAG